MKWHFFSAYSGMLYNYFKVALRHLLHNRIFSLINITGLAVGMTACYLIFQYVSFETSYDNFHSKADRIYRVVAEVKTPSETLPVGITVGPVAINLKKDFPEVEEAVRVAHDDLLVHKDNIRFQEKKMLYVDSGFFRVFDFPLIAGDKHTAMTAPMSVILSETAAKRYFGKSDPMGQHILLTGTAINATITGVMKDIPENSQLPADMLVSMSSFKPIYGQSTS